jgi:hypothetical protein
MYIFCHLKKKDFSYFTFQKACSHVPPLKFLAYTPLGYGTQRFDFQISGGHEEHALPHVKQKVKLIMNLNMHRS